MPRSINATSAPAISAEFGAPAPSTNALFPALLPGKELSTYRAPVSFDIFHLLSGVSVRTENIWSAGDIPTTLGCYFDGEVRKDEALSCQPARQPKHVFIMNEARLRIVYAGCFD